MRIRNALLIGITGLCSFGIEPGSSSHVLHERHERSHLEGWVKREFVDPQSTLPMRIGLRQSNTDAGHEMLMDM